MRVISHIYGFIMERSHGFWKIVIFIWYYSNLVNNQFLGSCRTWQNQSIEVFYKIAVLKNFAIFAGRYLWWSLFKKGLQFSIKNTLTEVFSCKYCKILMKICFIDICKRLLVTCFDSTETDEILILRPCDHLKAIQEIKFSEKLTFLTHSLIRLRTCVYQG